MSVEVELCPHCRKPVVKGIDKCPLCDTVLLEENVEIHKEEIVKNGLSLGTFQIISLVVLMLSIILYPFIGGLLLFPAIALLIITSILRFISIVRDSKKGLFEKYIELEMGGMIIAAVALIITIVALVILFLIFS